MDTHDPTPVPQCGHHPDRGSLLLVGAGIGPSRRRTGTDHVDHQLDRTRRHARQRRALGRRQEQSIEVHCIGEGASTRLLVDLQGYVEFIFDDE